MDTHRIGEVYDRMAPEFARCHSDVAPWLAELGVEFLALLPPAPRVLDLGCDAGRDMEWLEGQGARVTGADLSLGMLEEARRRVRGDLLRADMRALPLADSLFEGVWCMASLLHLPKADAPAALAEIRRVLASGRALMLGIKEGSGERWEPVPWDSTLQRFFARYSESEAREMLQSAGFGIIRSELEEGSRVRWLHFLARATPPYSSGDTISA